MLTEQAAFRVDSVQISQGKRTDSESIKRLLRQQAVEAAFLSDVFSMHCERFAYLNHDYLTQAVIYVNEILDK